MIWIFLSLLSFAPTPVHDLAEACPREMPSSFSHMVFEAASEFDVDPLVLLATAVRETHCRPQAVGATGELGIAQIHPKYWAEELQREGIINTRDDLRDIETSLRASAYIFSKHKRRSRDIWTQFRTYNGSGPAARKYADEQTIRLAKLRERFPMRSP